jgi:hypothetical protein
MSSKDWTIETLKPANALLERTIKQLTEEDGEDDAEEMTVSDEMGEYIDEIIDLLLADYDVTDDEAWEFISSVIADFESEEALPAYPEEEASDEEIQAWLDAAKEVGLADAVMSAANDASNEEE